MDNFASAKETLSLPAADVRALERMERSTGVSADTLLAQGVALLSITTRAKQKGLKLVFVEAPEPR